MHHPKTARKPLGEQQSRHLHQLRAASDQHIHRTHVAESPGRREAAAAVRQPTINRTIEAVVEQRALDKEQSQSTATRLRSKISAARSGIQTERSERSSDGAHHALLPSLQDKATRQPATGSRSHRVATTRKITAVCRREANEEKEQAKRRMGKNEAEWMEKQLQFAQRIASVEKECLTAWRAFYSGAGASSSSSPSNTPSLINRQLEEVGIQRSHDSRALLQQLSMLRRKTSTITVKVMQMRNGAQFFAELEELIQDMETSLSEFRVSQLKAFESYVFEENILAKELNIFVEKMEKWEQSDQNDNRAHVQKASAMQTNRSRPDRTDVVHLINPNSNEHNTNGHDVPGDRTGNEESSEANMVSRVRHLNEMILQSGGMKEGWDDRDHAVFQLVLAKCGLSDETLLRHFEWYGDNAPRPSPSNQDVRELDTSASSNADIDCEALAARFIRRCVRKLVMKTEEAIRSHLKWYIGHIRLVEEKKSVILEWRQSKEKQREQLLSNHDGVDPEDEYGKPGGEEPEHDGNKSDGSPKPEKPWGQRERARKVELLKEWREKKQQQELDLAEREAELQKQREEVEAKV